MSLLPGMHSFKVGMILMSVFGIAILTLLIRCMVSIPAGQVGIVIKKMGKDLPKGEVVASDPQYAGVQQEILPTGWHILNPITVEVKIVPAVQVPAGRVGIVNRKVGKAPQNRDDLLVDEGERGFQKTTLSPGTYFLNPYVEEVEIVDAVNVPSGHVGVVTSKTGKPSDKDLVDEGERGVWRKVLRPGTYYMNTRGYDVQIHPAVRIDAGFVGVVIARTGGEPKVPNAIVVERGERGVQPYTLPAGLHYLNPFEYEVITVDTRTQKYEMSQADTVLDKGEVSGDDRMYFPSADGFIVKVDTSIEWAIKTDNIPYVVATLGNTEDIVRKIIRPNARAIGRLEGSKLKAEEFIKGQKREQFVINFSDKLKERCAEKGIVIFKALVREVEGPEEVAGPLKEREVAILMQTTNEEKQRQAESEAKLAQEQARIEQNRQRIRAETEKLVAETAASREKAVAKIKAEQLKEVAMVDRERQQEVLAKQELEAKGIKAIAEAEAFRARSLIQADGALEKKLSTWKEVMTVWASNPNLVPKIVVGGASGSDGRAGLTGQELIMNLLAIERLERFANSKLGDLETQPPAARAAVGPQAEEPQAKELQN